MTTQTHAPAERRMSLSDYERAIQLLRIAASDARQSDARRRWIRAATQC
ncbi:hypothetical protein KIH27_13505 [Mycobacterium sp. M1]|uniref:Uncharacterized protein n=1 Tax=Mycolicibacter acidiphilus TaxID=2835306 RepID=A0ABS5RNX6_9MYCO|nr:hypothetical protein [Mycolicibacter acidiphilus]MBS9534604.1 hypothetical protein [Mycolicibacter acidiphilus]